tara:strand:+ start:908 stop:1489 length:582 start_codon:yes stop_codon:yes gene_type:complete
MSLIRHKVLLPALAVGVLAICGCTSIQLVSNYDETIDKQTQQLQKKLDGYFVSLQNSSDEDLKYKNQQKFYEGALTDLNAMQVRASGIYKNKKTIEQIELARENLAYLVLLHKHCVSGPLSGDQTKEVKENGIDLSMNCEVKHGASADEANRGDMMINRFTLVPIQSLFNQHLGSIMALELAKKRGDQKKDEE